MPTLAEIKRDLQQELPHLREKYHVRSLWVFGSRVRGEETPESDLDLLIEFERPPSLIRFIEMEQHLSRRLGVNVDLVSKGSLRRRRGARILAEVQHVPSFPTEFSAPFGSQ